VKRGRWVYRYSASEEQEHDAAEKAEGVFKIEYIEVKGAEEQLKVQEAQAEGEEYELGIAANIVKGPLREELEEEYGVPIDPSLKKTRQK
jgi:hypothetical protein